MDHKINHKRTTLRPPLNMVGKGSLVGHLIGVPNVFTRAQNTELTRSTEMDQVQKNV